MLPAFVLLLPFAFQDTPVRAAESAPAAVPAPAAAIDPVAHATFLRMCERLDQGQVVPPITSFRLNVNTTRRHDGQVNQGAATLAWRAPSHVRIVVESGREQARGPEGYWLKEAKDAPVEKLVGRDNADSRREIDEIAAMCHNFAALARAREWKLSRLVRLAAPPSELPRALREAAASLEWIELSSPDFQLLDEVGPGGAIASGPKEYRVRIGLVRATSKLPKGLKYEPDDLYLLAIGEQRDGIDILGTQVLLKLDPLRTIEHAGSASGLRVPSRMYMRRVDAFSPASAFEDVPYFEIGIAGGSKLGLELPDAEFAP